MQANQNLPETVGRDHESAACAPAGQPNLVIENLAELAAAGRPETSVCWADYAVPRISGHQCLGSPWIPQTAA